MIHCSLSSLATKAPHLGAAAVEIITCYKVNEVLNYMSQALVRYMVQDRLIS